MEKESGTKKVYLTPALSIKWRGRRVPDLRGFK
jgi:hypothetical protein